jgi:plastocyanin
MTEKCRYSNKPRFINFTWAMILHAKNGVFVAVLTAAIIGLASTLTINAFDVTLSVSQKPVFAQGDSESSSSMTPMNGTGANLTSPFLPTLTIPGLKEFYLFTAEIPDVDEEKLKVAGDAFSIPTMIVNKGDNVTVHFYNVDPVTDERHSFTIGSPYNVDADIAFGETEVVSFMADHEGIFQYYCKYHLPVMTGQLLVVP